MSHTPDPSRQVHRRALLFTDIVGSTRLLAELGDLAGNRLIHEHHRLAARMLLELGAGECVNTGGDSMFLAFPDVRTALRFALALQRQLRDRQASAPPHRRIRDRMGIHIGEVEVSSRPDGARDLIGVAVSLAWSVQQLAAADQVLLSEPAFDEARAGADHGELASFPELRWLNHGRYRLKGFEDPAGICEVGEPGIAPLQPPGHPLSGEGAEDVARGWRPAVGAHVPDTRWHLVREMGRRGYGEVWTARDPQNGEQAVLRFFFRVSRLRALRDATTLFQRLESGTLDSPRVARLRHFQFDRPPWHVEEEYAEGLPLPALCHAMGWGPRLTEVQRLEIAAQIAEALAVAHQAGIVHGDLKPSSVLVRLPQGDQAQPQVKVTDFGTGQLAAAELAAGHAERHRTPTGRAPDSDPLAAPLYWAPELYNGSPTTPRSDVYALGVLAFQLLVCDLKQPVTVDVARRITDRLLLEDVTACLATDPSARLSAADLAVRLRQLPQRRARLNRLERRAYWQGVGRTAVVAAFVVAAIAWLALRASEARRLAETREVRLGVVNSVRLLESGDLPGALAQTVDALRLGVLDQRSEEVQRRRFGSIFRAAAREVNAWTLPGTVSAWTASPDGQRIAAGDLAGNIRVWPADGRSSPIALTASGPVDALGFAPDGAGLFAHGRLNQLHQWRLEGWGGDARMTTRPLGGWGAVVDSQGQWMAVIAGAGLRLASLTDDGLYEVEAPVPLNLMAFSRTGRFLAAGSTNREVRLLDLKARAWLPARLVLQGWIEFLDFDASDAYLLVGAEKEGHIARVPDLQPVMPRAVHTDHLMWAGFAPRGSLYFRAASGYGARAVAGDAAGFLAMPTVLPHPHSMTRCAFSPDGRYILTGSFDRQLRLWDPANSAWVCDPVRHPPWQDTDTFRLGFLPDGRRFVTTVDRSVRLFDLAPPAFGVESLALEEPIELLALSRDGTRIVTASQGGLAAVWDADTSRRIGNRIRFPGHLDQVLFKPDRSAVLAVGTGAGHTRQAWLADLTRTNPPPVALAGVLPAPPVLAFFGIEGRFHVVTADGTWLTWNSETPLTTPPTSRATGGAASRVTATRDGSLLAILDQSREPREIRVYNVETGNPVGKVLHPPHEVRRMTFSPDKRRLMAACSDRGYQPRSAVEWDLASSSVTAELPHTDGVMIASYDPTARRAVTGGEDCLVRFWDLRNGALVAEQRMGYQALDVVHSADGLLVASASVDGSARVWDPVSGTPVTPLLRHPMELREVFFTAGARRVLTRCIDGRAYLWDLEAIAGSVDQLSSLTAFLQGNTPEQEAPEARQQYQVAAHWSPDLEVPAVAQAEWHRRESVRCLAAADDEAILAARLADGDASQGPLRTTDHARRMEEWLEIALLHLEEATRAHPSSWLLHWERSRLFRRLDRTQDEAAALRRVLELDPDCDAARERLLSLRPAEAGPVLSVDGAEAGASMR